MVRGPKASRACQTCKLRRIKCDETFPVCNRCKASGRECVGNLKQSEFIFRNETPEFPPTSKRGARKREKQKEIVNPSAVEADSFFDDANNSASSGSGSDTTTSSTSSSDGEERPLTQSYWLTPCIKDVVLYYWIDNFASRSSTPVMHLHYIPQLVLNSSISSPLYQATTAISLASLSRFDQFRFLRSESDTEYGKALQVVNKALADPVVSKSDDTLLSVMLLAMHAALVPTEKSLSTYYKHMRGAMLLLRHRGYEQFKDPRSLCIFRSIRNQLVSTSIRTTKPIDTVFDDPFWKSDLGYDDNPTNSLFVAAMDLPALLLQIEGLIEQPLTSASLEEACMIVSRLRQLDVDLIEWRESLPQLNRPTTKDTASQEPLNFDNVDTTEVWPGKLTFYGDIYTAHPMNNWRNTRLHIHEAILNYLTWANANPLGPSYEASLGVIQDMVDGICGSLPFFMNYAETEKFVPGRYKTRKQIADDARGAYMVTWHLGSVLRLKCISELQQRWVRGRLKYIADWYGFRQAKVFMKTVRGQSRAESSGAWSLGEPQKKDFDFLKL